MITPAPILNNTSRFSHTSNWFEFEYVTQYLVHCESEGFALVGRIKALDSVAEKVETGRFLILGKKLMISWHSL